MHERQQAQDSFYEFVRQGWSEIEIGTPFVGGWYLRALCEHLEALYRGDIKNLLVNVPPRTTKTITASSMFPAWVWTHNPSTQFMCLSHTFDLAIEASLKHRYLVTSDWYQLRWGHLYALRDDQNTKTKFSNTMSGYRVSTGILSKTTGKGANFLIVDDANNAIESDLERESVNKRWNAVLSTRLNDLKTDKRMVIQQRTHEKDLSGHILDSVDSSDWVKLILPMEFESKRRTKTIILPSTNGKIWRDPRKEEGELLCPERFGPNEVKRLKNQLSSQYLIAGQLQQRPAPEEGGIIKKKWFKWWDKSSPPKIQQVIQSWDTALEVNDKDSFSACTTWGLFEDQFGISNLILLNLWRERAEYPDLRRMAKIMYEDYRNNGEMEITPDGRHVPDMVLIESKASGDPLIQDLRRAGISATKFDPSQLGDKIKRVRLISHIIEAGRIWVPAKPPRYHNLRGYANTLVELCGVFPNSDSRDVVDTMTQVIHKVLRGGFVNHPTDVKGHSTLSHEPPILYGIQN